jgi:hypothetical protein
MYGKHDICLRNILTKNLGPIISAIKYMQHLVKRKEDDQMKIVMFTVWRGACHDAGIYEFDVSSTAVFPSPVGNDDVTK